MCKHALCLAFVGIFFLGFYLGITYSVFVFFNFLTLNCLVFAVVLNFYFISSREWPRSQNDAAMGQWLTDGWITITQQSRWRHSIDICPSSLTDQGGKCIICPYQLLKLSRIMHRSRPYGINWSYTGENDWNSISSRRVHCRLPYWTPLEDLRLSDYLCYIEYPTILYLVQMPSWKTYGKIHTIRLDGHGDMRYW